jgi:glycosyltransferase involved in cell wall biosynthesis
LRIGIIEIMPIGHYTLVDSIARIHLACPEDEVFVFLNKGAENNFIGLKEEMKGRLTILAKKENISIKNFFAFIESFKIDVLYFTTPEKNFSDLYYFKFHQPIRIVIHNIDSWFDINFTKQLYKFSQDLNWKNCIYKFKTCFIYSFWRSKIIGKILSDKGKLIVLNNNIKEELSKYIDDDNIIVIPFSVYKDNTVDLSKNNVKIRICIPGIVDSIRRDYNSVFTIFEEELASFKDIYELDLLGPLRLTQEGLKIKKRIDNLIKSGMKVFYYATDYIPLDEYDSNLLKSNLILGNLNVILDKFSSYGKTKESGIAYAMIRSAKPGILPSRYPIINELKSSTLTFNSYEDLKSILLMLSNKKEKLSELINEAKKNSLYFTPSNLLKNIN